MDCEIGEIENKVLLIQEDFSYRINHLICNEVIQLKLILPQAILS